MSNEKFPNTPATQDSENKEALLENLYNRLPKNLSDMWRDRLEDLAVEEQISQLKTILEKRGGQANARQEYRLMPKGVEIFKSFPDDLRETIETIRNGKRTVEIGYGKAGHVIANPKVHPDICYKLLFDDEQLPPATNDISQETELQQDIGKLLDKRHGVMVPHVYGFISEPGTRAITMELMNAPSLRRVVERQKEPMPKNFDFDTFFNALENFLHDMHALGYYHRDFHAGNVLVHRETGMPCVIDFGLSKYAPIEDLDIYREKAVVDGQMDEIVFKSDEARLLELKDQVKHYLANVQGV